MSACRIDWVAVATVVGPVVAVLVTVWLQSLIAKTAEADRQKFQKELLALQAKYAAEARNGWQTVIDAWATKIIGEIKKKP